MLCAKAQAGAAADEDIAADDAGGAEAGAIHQDAPMEEALCKVMFRGACARVCVCSTRTNTLRCSRSIALTSSWL
jgi:hypothetical protein